MGELDGRVAIVTGAARGQGEAAARRFVEEGARVVLGDVLDELGHAVAEDLGDAATYRHHDISSEADWAAAVGVAQSWNAGLHVLVNNAGIHHLASVQEETADGFRRIFEVNLMGTFLGIHSACGPMAESGGGSIINVSSTAGLAGYPGHAAYSSSKWGIRGLTRCAALDLATSRIRVNSIHPGPIDTAMAPRGPDGEPPPYEAVPLRRAGEPREVSELVLFLASDRSSYINGAELTIDGGMMAGPMQT